MTSLRFRGTHVIVGVVLFTCSTALAQIAPVVSNVRASQRPDGSRLVDVFYDLSHNAPCTVWVVFSDDGGVSWRVPAKSVTGDLGNSIAPGVNRHIVWDAPADIPGVAGTYRTRVYADDNSAQGNMVFVPEGSFPYRRNFSSPIYVGPFWIDKYHVTIQRYAEFLNDADPDGTYWSSAMGITRSGQPPNVFYAVNPGQQNYPIRYVSYYDAVAYAAWLSAREGRTYRLPTEQEWEKAAAWDPVLKKHWLYGFQSDEITCADANFSGCVGEPTEVGHYNGVNEGTNDSRSYYGCYDISGNVRDWTRTIWITGARYIRGGSWANSSSDSATTSQGVQNDGARLSSTGFRLVLYP